MIFKPISNYEPKKEENPYFSSFFLSFSIIYLIVRVVNNFTFSTLFYKFETKILFY